MDDYLDWMSSEEGQEAEMAISLVHDFLEKATQENG